MNILKNIRNKLYEARKNRELLIISILNPLLSDIMKIGKDDGNREPLDSDAIKVIKKYIKNIEENLKLKLSDDQLTKYIFEKDLLLSYLPKAIDIEILKNELNLLKGKSKSEIFKILKIKFGDLLDSSTVNILMSI